MALSAFHFRRVVWMSALLAAASALAWLLWPLADPRWHITEGEVETTRRKEGLAALAKSLPKSMGRRPNILVILADDLGRQDLSSYGPSRSFTPRLDALAAKSLRFSQATCTAPICAPSRASLLTGRYPQRSGFELQPMHRYPVNRLQLEVYSRFMLTDPEWRPASIPTVPRLSELEKQGLSLAEPTLAEYLKSAGYRTGIVGKWHLGSGPGRKPMDRGFDSAYGFLEAFTLYAPRGSEKVVEAPHGYFADRHIWAQGRMGLSAVTRQGAEIEEPRYLTDAIGEEVASFLVEKSQKPFFLYVPYSAPHTPFQALKADLDRYPDVADTNRRVYLAMITSLDRSVGRILDALTASGQDKNTLVVFASDNGGAKYTGACMDGVWRGGKFTFFEGGLGVPLLVSLPGIAPGVFDQPVSLMDLAPTFLELAGVPVLAGVAMDGRSLAPVLKGGFAGWEKRRLFWGTLGNRAARLGSWKYLAMGYRKGGGNDGTPLREYLFDLQKDPGETENLAAMEPERLKGLRDAWVKWNSQMPPAKWPHVMDYVVLDRGETFTWPL